MGEPAGKLTQLVKEIREGNSESFRELFDAVYQELKRIARGQVRARGRGLTVSPTTLVHEVFESFQRREGLRFEDRSHFFAVAALCMRNLLRDQIKAKRREKRGGEAIRVTLDEAIHGDAAGGSAIDLYALEDALTKLERQDERLARVVELRFLAGLTAEEIAEALGVSVITVKRDWRLAKAWLHAHLADTPGVPDHE